MDLTLIPGIGPEYSRRLSEAGVPDVAALAAVPDLSTLAERTGIAPSRLAAFQASALDLHEDSGIAIATVAPFQEMAQTLWRAAEDAREEADALARQARATLQGALAKARAQADETLAHAERGAARTLQTLRQALGSMGKGKST